jgi:hypothetical protein
MKWQVQVLPTHCGLMVPIACVGCVKAAAQHRRDRLGQSSRMSGCETLVPVVVLVVLAMQAIRAEQPLNGSLWAWSLRRGSIAWKALSLTLAFLLTDTVVSTSDRPFLR